jgi:hypothetical protein
MTLHPLEQFVADIQNESRRLVHKYNIQFIDKNKWLNELIRYAIIDEYKSNRKSN